MIIKNRKTNKQPLKFLFIVLVVSQLSLLLIGKELWHPSSVDYTSFNEKTQKLKPGPVDLKKTLSRREDYLWLNSRLREKAKRMREIKQIINVMNRYRNSLSADSKKDLTRLILMESKKYKYDPLLIVAMIMTESGFNTHARSWVGARGLMQIRPRTGRAVAKRIGLEWHGIKSLYDPHFSIKSGLYYLSAQKEEFGDLNISLAAYNWGPTAIRRMLSSQRVIPLHYAKKVIREYKKLKEEAKRGTVKRRTRL